MLAFTRLTSVIFFVLSLSWLVCALPRPTPVMHGQKPGTAHALSVRGHHEGAGNIKVLLGAVVDLKAKVVARADVISNIQIGAHVQAQAEVDRLIADIELCSSTIAELKTLNIDAQLKASIAGHVLVIIKAIIKICGSLSVKFGIQVFFEVFAKLDASLKVLLRGLDGCMDGFLVILAKLLVEADMRALAEAKLILCHDMLVLIRAAVGIVIGA
ncbi:transmembrane protein, putative [Rhizoctonia solani]|uniref:Transmembrane protein, putative n=1 Tax=Rhizoctonia solani TaxID=456999 RepID=A0A8H8NKS3_9AGAM|nr:uncharacterized protein RhiXN_03560 [Rhizoctonia solani]QRW15559.1 transmembrane protein, putative [Rhizoctonia solani]